MRISTTLTNILDDMDLRILDVVQRNAPMTTAELAERVGMSQSPCWRRLTRLREDGFIVDQVTRLSPEKLGLRTNVFANVKLSAHGRTNLNEFIEAVSRIPEVLEIHPTMGPFDFLLRIITRDVEDYRELVFGRLLTLPTVQEINSTMSLGPVKMTTALPIR
jgi:Lrp/AsnC family transcriptional regulator